MAQRMSAWEARRHFGSVLRKVSSEHTSVIVESHGEPVAVIVPLSTYERDERRRAKIVELIRKAQRNTGMDEEESMALALEVQHQAPEQSS